MSLLIYKSKSELIEDVAEYVIAAAQSALAEQDCFNFVLTGGNSPKDLYHLLSTTYRETIDWTKVYFFIGDERNVPPGHESYNGLMAKKALLDPLNIAADHIFFVDTTLEPKEAADDYYKKISAHFNESDLSFDLILLGMGDDAHTASLFPGTSVLQSKEVRVESVYVDKLSTYRITFTAGLINKAKNVAFLVFGENKAEALKHVIDDKTKNFEAYPSQLIAPIDGKLTWFVDAEAASLLDS